MEEQEHKSDESIENATAAHAKPVDANKIPKPVPSGGNTEIKPSEHPLSEDTISIKKPDLTSPKEKAITFDDEENSNQEGSSQTPDQSSGESSEADKTPEEPPPSEDNSPESAEPTRRLKIFCYNCGQKLDLTSMEPFSQIDCPSCNHELIVPKWWDNYLLEESCGVGGMAKVYRALDLALDREVAIKILNDNIADDESRSKMFLHEARTAATLNHYAILPIYTCGEFEGQAYFVMQYMGGGSLEQELERDEDHPLSISEAVKWLKDICEALDNARRHGIIHHDIKPGNFMLDDDRNVKIGDFGISQALHDSRSEELNELTKEWGSPEYVSPEKILTKSETYLGDIYSLGATFYHLLTKETPFDNHDIASMLKAKTIKDPIDIKKLRSDIPDSIAKLIMSMMDRTPEARPTYRDIVAELNSMKKASAPLAVKKRAAASGPKRQPVVRQPAPRTPMTIEKGTMDTFDPAKYGIKKKNPILSLIKVIIFLGVLSYAAVYLWDNGYLAGIIPNAPEPYKTDYLPKVTKLISAGQSIEASKIANMKLNTSDLSGAALKQAVIQLAINAYLNNAPDPAQKCKALAQRLLSADVSPDSPEMVILKYLYEKNADADTMREDLLESQAKELMLVGEVAIFVKDTYLNASRVTRKVTLKSYASLSSNVPEGYWGLGWGKRIQTWYDWTASKKVDTSNLEPLFRRTKSGLLLMQESNSASSNTSESLTISSLTPQWLEEHRSFASERPKPEDYVLNEEIASAYIAGLPDQYKEQESKRLKLISRIKFKLCKDMLIQPYKGAVQLLDGTALSGRIIGNSRELICRNSTGTLKKIAWSELHIDQFVKMLTFYAQKLETQDKDKAAKEYLTLAVLSDWYGRYKNAVSFANKALSVNHELEPEVINYMMK